MILIIGGAYQGKLNYAIENYNISLDEVFQCEGKTETDGSKKVINNIQLLFLEQIKQGEDPVAYIYNNLETLKEKIIICEDISCGIVPIDKTMRFWRECTGHCLSLLSKECSEVVRIFCGLGMKIK